MLRCGRLLLRELLYLSLLLPSLWVSLRRRWLCLLLQLLCCLWCISVLLTRGLVLLRDLRGYRLLCCRMRRPCFRYRPLRHPLLDLRASRPRLLSICRGFRWRGRGRHATTGTAAVRCRRRPSSRRVRRRVGKCCTIHRGDVGGRQAPRHNSGRIRRWCRGGAARRRNLRRRDALIEELWRGRGRRACRRELALLYRGTAGCTTDILRGRNVHMQSGAWRS